MTFVYDKQPKEMRNLQEKFEKNVENLSKKIVRSIRFYGDKRIENYEINLRFTS
jgi:hypothetical protein